MTRILVALVVLIALPALAVPIAPLEPRIQPPLLPVSSPEAASDGTSTLVAWVQSPGSHPGGTLLWTRIPEKQSAGVLIGSGNAPQVAWNGTHYLVAYGIPGSRFGHSPFPDVAFRIIHPDGSLGEERRISTSDSGFAFVGDLVWDGEHWIAGVTESESSLVTLDRELRVVARIDVPDTRRLTLTTIDGDVWAVQTRRDNTTEVFAVDDRERRHHLAAEAELAGRLVVSQRDNGIELALFDPSGGFSAATAHLEGAMRLDVHAIAGGGAKVIYRIGTQVFVAVVNGSGSIIETTHVVDAGFEFTSAAVTDDETFVTVSSTIRRYPSGENIALIDTAYQRHPVIVATGDHATAFWVQTTEDGEATFTRKVDANGVPFGEITRLPFTHTADAEAVFDGQRALLVWTENARGVFLYDGQTVHHLGAGAGPKITSGTHGTFIIWTSHSGMVRGTPYPQLVPQGFEILPSLSSSQVPLDITPLGDGFMILWSEETLTSVIVSPSGAVRTSSVFSSVPKYQSLAAGTLAAWRSKLFGYTPAGQPLGEFDPQWGDWQPVAIHDLGGQRHHITITRDFDALSSAIVTVSGGVITSITALDFLGVYRNPSVTRVGNRTLVAHGNGRVEVEAHGEPLARRRAVRR